MRIVKSPIKPTISIPPCGTVGAYPPGMIFGMWMNEGGRLSFNDFVQCQSYDSHGTNFKRFTGPGGRSIFFNDTDGTYGVRTSGGTLLISPKAYNPKTIIYRMSFQTVGDFFQNVIQKCSNGTQNGWAVSHFDFSTVPPYQEVKLLWRCTGAHFGGGDMNSVWSGSSLGFNFNSPYTWDIAIVMDGGVIAANQKMYFNGVLGTFDAGNSTDGVGALDDDINAYLSVLTSTFDGTLEHIFMFDRSLSAQEVRDMHTFPYRWYAQDTLDWVTGAGGSALSSIPGLMNTPTRSL